MKSFKFILPFILLISIVGCKTRNPKISTNSQETTIVEQPKWVNVQGEKLHYIEQGEGEPIILIHGAIGDYNAWNFQMDTLALNHRVISISRRYAWPNNQPSRNDSFECTVALHSKDLVSFMEKMNIPSAHLMGHSYGAMIALRTAVDNPELVKSMVLGEPVIYSIISGSEKGDSLVNDFRNNAKAAVKLYRQGKDEETLRQFFRTVLGSDELYDIVPKSARDGWKQNLVEGICISQTQDFAFTTREELSGIQQPVLLIKGEHSPEIMKLVNDSLNVILPNSKLKLLSDASHGLQGQNPGDFNRYVINFLNRLR